MRSAFSVASGVADGQHAQHDQIGGADNLHDQEELHAGGDHRADADRKHRPDDCVCELAAGGGEDAGHRATGHRLTGDQQNRRAWRQAERQGGGAISEEERQRHDRAFAPDA
ncbi:MAG: hypothetical protein WDN76_02950 [Alphaproteobacteria bacterium]